MKVYTRDEFQIFIVGNYISNYSDIDDGVFDHSSYYGVYNVEPQVLKLIEKKQSIYKTHIEEINSKYFIDSIIASRRIENLNHNCLSETLLENGYKLIGGRYFIPKYQKEFDYFVNRMVNAIDGMKQRWKYEISKLLKKIKTPLQVMIEVRNTRVAFGVEDFGDSEVAGRLAMIKRERIYKFLIQSYYAQFIHLIGSVIEDSFVKGLLSKGIDINSFNRNVLYRLVFDFTKKKFEDIPYFENYSNFIMLWNFMKHNNKTSYEAVKSNCPQYLSHEKEFLLYGHSSQKYLNIDENLIYDILDGLKVFFISFSKFVFDEDYEEAKWNYFDYFVEASYETYKRHLMPT